MIIYIFFNKKSSYIFQVDCTFTVLKLLKIKIINGKITFSNCLLLIMSKHQVKSEIIHVGIINYYAYILFVGENGCVLVFTILLDIG